MTGRDEQEVYWLLSTLQKKSPRKFLMVLALLRLWRRDFMN